MGKASRAKQDRRDLVREVNAEIQADDRLTDEEKRQLKRYDAKRGMSIVGNREVSAEVRFAEADRLARWVLFHPMAEATRFAIRMDVGDISTYEWPDICNLLMEVCEEQADTGIVLAFNPA